MKFDLDMKRFAADPDAGKIMRLMLFINDVARFDEMYYSNPKWEDRGEIGLGIHGYRLTILGAHLSEAYLILEKIGRNSALFTNFIAPNSVVKVAYDKAQELGGHGARYSALLQRWRKARNEIVFHYGTDRTLVEDAVTQVAAVHDRLAVTFGDSQQERHFFNPAYDVQEAVWLKVNGFDYISNNPASEILTAEFQELFDALVIFSIELLKVVCQQYRAI